MSTKTTAKKPYKTASLKKYGSLGELTQTNVAGTTTGDGSTSTNQYIS
jgi:hypothetical protein